MNALLQEKPMPCPVTLAWTTIAFFIPGLYLVANAVLMTPGAADKWAAAGMVFGAFLTAIYAIQAKRTGWQMITAVTSSAFVGFVMPGIVIYNTPILKDYSATLTFHAWAGAGFIFALLGTGLVEAFIRWRDRNVDKIVAKRMGRLMGMPDSEEKTD